MYHQKQFERWAKTKELDITKHPEKDKWGFEYLDIQTQMFWECWCAAQEDDEEATLAFTNGTPED